MSHPARGVEPAPPAWAQCLPAPGTAQAAWEALRDEWEPVEAAVEAMALRHTEQTEKAQREALLRVHTRLVELSQQRGTPYATAFEAYMLHAGGRWAGGAGRRGRRDRLCSTARLMRHA